MAISVTRSPSTWNTLSTTVREKWLNENDARDIVTKATPTIWWMNKRAKREPLPNQLVVRLLDTEAGVGDAFEYYDTVSTATTQGPRAGQTTARQYSFPLTLSHQEELEHMSPQAMANWIDIKMKQILMYAAKRLNIDLYGGDTSNAKRITGMEQIYHAARPHSAVYTGSTIVYSGDVWRLRQATNTYLGIARSAFTADEAGGTGWENVSLDYRSDPTNRIQHDTTNGIASPDAGLIGLSMAYDAATYGLDRPNVMFSTRAPYQRYHFAVQTKTMIYKTADAFSGAELQYIGLNFNGVPWFVDEFAKTWNTSLATNPNITDLNNIYGINTDVHRLWIDPRWDFAVTDVREPVDQHVGVKHLLFRGQQVCESPRMGFRCFDIED